MTVHHAVREPLGREPLVRQPFVREPAVREQDAAAPAVPAARELGAAR
ncbi:hypothetical protein [Streptomyces sclerotialus]